MTPRKAAAVGLLVEHIVKRWGLYRAITPTNVENMLLGAIADLLGPSLPLDERGCQWPGCGADALCTSGNFGGRLVCARHFAITNGPANIRDDRSPADSAW